MCLFLFGSNANNSGKAGSFTVNANNEWTNANTNIGSQVCLFLNTVEILTLPLGKIQSKASFGLVGLISKNQR